MLPAGNNLSLLQGTKSHLILNTMAKKTAKKAAPKKAVPKKAAKKAAPKPAKKTATPKKARKVNPALLKPYTPSADLAAVIGSKPLSRGPRNKSRFSSQVRAGL
jgi:chromatin remodeling complex protein RSC6